MPSSTSSFDRPVPARPWLALGLAALVLTSIFLAGWELVCRSWGYAPSYEDTPDLWAIHRDSVASDSMVIVGSSRVVFDLDLDVFEGHFGTRPIQLAIVGSTPRAALSDLIADPSFRGTVFVGVTPNLFFAPGGPPVEKTDSWLAARRRRSPSGRIGHVLGRRLEERLAFLNSEDLSLEMLLGRIESGHRPGTFVPPRLPPYFGELRFDRQCLMTDRMATEEAFQKEVQDVWQGLSTAAPPMDEEALNAIREGILADMAEKVASFRERGGRVIFLRLPSTEWLREFEAQTVPRRAYWDRLLEATKSHGVHFEDEQDLRDWDCPEWSHLRREDAVYFSEKLVPILETLLAKG